MHHFWNHHDARRIMYKKAERAYIPFCALKIKPNFENCGSWCAYIASIWGNKHKIKRAHTSSCWCVSCACTCFGKWPPHGTNKKLFPVASARARKKLTPRMQHSTFLPLLLRVLVPEPSQQASDGVWFFITPSRRRFWSLCIIFLLLVYT